MSGTGTPGLVPHFLHVFSTFAVGGPQMRAADLIARSNGDVRHTIVAMDGRRDAAARVPDGIDVRYADAPGGGALARWRGMRAVLRGSAPNLLLTYNWGAIEWLAAARSVGLHAIVHHEDGFGPEELAQRFRRRNVARRLLLRGVRAVAVPSRVLERIARDEWGVGSRRLRYLPNGVDVDRFRPADGSRAARGGEAPFVFVAVGGVRPEKNQAHGVRALARMRDATVVLRIVGDGPDVGAVRALADELGVGDRVELVGAVTDTAPCYRDADAFLIPSRTEQMPIALLEAMASGLPVAGTDVGDVASIVAPANRTSIVARDDVDALARAMDALAADRAACRRLGHDNRDHVVATYPRDACDAAWLAVYRAACEPLASS